MAKRANKKLVAALTVTVMVGLTIIAFAMLRYLPGKDPQSWVTRAEQLAEQKHYQDATLCYEKAAGLAKAADRPVTEINEYLVLAGDMAMQAGNARLAERRWRDVILNDPGNAQAQERIVKLYLEYTKLVGGGYWATLEKEASALLAISGSEKNYTGLHALGLALVEQRAVDEKNLERGKEKLIEAFNGDKSNPEFAQSLANLHRFQNESDKGKHVYEVLLDPANRSNDPEKLASSHRNRGQFYLMLKADKLRELRQAQSDARPERELTKLREEIEAADKQSLDDFKTAVDIDSNNVESLVALGRYWHEKESAAKNTADSMSENEGFRLKAVGQYKKAIEADPDSYDGYLWLSQLYASEREFDKALQVLQTRMDRGVRKDHYLGWRNEAYMRVVRNEAFRVNLAMWVEAGRQLQEKEALEAEHARIMERLEDLYNHSVTESAAREKDPGALFMKGRIEMLRKNNREAIDALRQADEQSGGNNMQIKQLLASLYIETGAPGAATEHLQAILNASPNNEVALSALAEVYARTDKPRRAIEEAKRVLQINPKNTQVLETMVRAYQQLGDMGSARQIIQQLEKASGGEDVRLKLRRAIALYAEAAEEEPPSAALLKESEQLLLEILDGDPFNGYAFQHLVSVMETRKASMEDIRQLLDQAQSRAKEGTAQAQAAGDDEKAKRIDRFRRAIDFMRIGLDQEATTEEKETRAKGLLEAEPDEYMRALGLFNWYRAQGDMEDKAMEQLKRALELRPDDPSLIQLAFRYALRSKDWDFAQQCVDRCIELDADGGKGHFFKGRLLLAKEDTAEAAKELRAGLAENPSYSNGHLYLADTLMLLGHYDESEYEFKEAQRLNPANSAAVVGLAILATTRNDQDARLAYLQQCAKVAPNHPWVRQQLRFEEDRRDPKQGIARREQIRQDPEHAGDIDNLIQLAGLYSEQRQYDQAQEVYEDAMQRDVLNIRLARTYVRFLHNRQPPDPQRADALIRKMIDAIKPSDTAVKADAQLLLAEHLKIQAGRGGPGAPSLKDVDQAYLAAYETSATPAMGVEVGLYYASTNRPKEAEQWYRKAMSHPDAREQVEAQRRVRILLIELMLRYQAGQQDDQTQKEIDEFRRLYPDDKRVMLFQGEFYSATGRQQEAVKEFTEFVKGGGDPLFGYYRRGHAYFRRGQWDEAIKDLEEVKRLSPSFADYQARMLLANAYARRGNQELARAELESILESNPNLPQVVEELFMMYTGTEPPMLDSAERLLRPRMAEEPNYYLWPLLLANVPGMRGEQDEAIKLVKRAVELGGANKRTVAGLLNVYLYFNRFDDVITFMKEEFKEAQGSADIYMIAARAYAGKKDYPNAIKQSLLAFQADDARYDTMFSYFVRHVAPKPVPQPLLPLLDERLSENPNDAGALFFRAAVLYQRSEMPEYIETVSKLLNLPSLETSIQDRLQPFLTRQLAVAYFETKAYSQAATLYEGILKDNPDDTFALNNLATILMDHMNKPEEAMPYSKRVAELTPQNPLVLDTLGWNQVLVGDLDSGIASISQALEKITTIATIHYHLAEAYFRRSKDPNARNQRSDRMEAEASCKQAHSIVMKAGTDAEGVFPQILNLGKQLGLELSGTLPGAGSANRP